MRISDKTSLLYCQSCKALKVFEVEPMHARCSEGHCFDCGRKKTDPCAECRKYMRMDKQRLNRYGFPSWKYDLERIEL